MKLLLLRPVFLVCFVCLAPPRLAFPQVIISEFMANNNSGLIDDFGNRSDWIEIYNPSSSPVNLFNWALSDDDTLPMKWRFPSTNIGPKSFMVIFASDTNRAVAGLPLHTGFNLGAGGEYLALRTPAGVVATEFSPEFPEQTGDYSYGISQTAVTNILLRNNATAKVLVPGSGALGTNWTTRSFNDSTWSPGTNGIGYETGNGSYRPRILTDIQNSMLNLNASAYIRIPFVATNAAAINSLFLRINYDDGFVAFLNGQEVARRNAPATLQYNSIATAAHPGLAAEEINISASINALQTGTNIVAIQGLNGSAGDPDFLIGAELIDYQITSSSNHFFYPGTPGALNDGGFFAFVADTKFSYDRGFYDTPFSLVITTDTAGASIRFTTNGTPPSLTNGFVYTGPISVTGTKVVRAAAFKDGFEPSNVDTHSYIFVGDVIRQSANGAPPPGWPASWGGNTVDYGMDPDVVNNPLYASTITNDLKTLPSFCIVTDLKNLFDPTIGIYANPGQDGIDWERPTSVELIYPDGTEGFQIDAGLRIRGGFSRSTGNPKHAFRFFFRQEYGAPKLKYPLFGDEGTDTFDALDLRTFQNYSWSFGGDSRGIFLRDQFCRDTQLAMGHQSERGNFYHLYINGQYWGLFNTCERPEASYGAMYYGGNKEDYDVVKVEAGPYAVNATDGTLDEWNRLWTEAAAGLSSDAAFQRIQGNNPDGTRNPLYEPLVDVPNLIDYMLIILYGGNLDAPISWFLSEDSPNNWYGLRNRTGNFGGFRFMVHDAEHTLLNTNENRTGLVDGQVGVIDSQWTAGNPATQIINGVYTPGAAFSKSNPQYIWFRLVQNAEFRMLVADHVHRHFFNGGVLTVSSTTNLFLKRKAEIDRAVVAESARWGDAKRPTAPFTRQDWLNAINNVLNNYLPARSGNVLQQLRADGLYPSLSLVAPVFSQHGGTIPAGFNLNMSAPAGTIYYTSDGTDPRLPGGTISPTALLYSGSITLIESTQIKARTFNGSQWSALNDATFYINQTFTNLVVTEIMYHPPGAANFDGDDFEFIELKNISSSPMELSGVRFTNGLNYTFPLGTFLSPGGFIVLISNPTGFTNRYPGVAYDGIYTGKLSNGGETLSLVHANSNRIFSFAYTDAAPWPQTPDGQGFSLVPLNPTLNFNSTNPANWRASSAIGGSPRADDPGAGIDPVWINEILTHTDPPLFDTIELHNPNTNAVDVTGWYLTDDRLTPQKYRIVLGNIPAGGYLVIDERAFNANPGSSNSFQLNSHGDEVFLYSADPAGNLTGFSDGFSYGASANAVTFGRYTTSIGEVQYPAQTQRTFGSANSGPVVGPVVINEIRYHPAVGAEEFIELKNLSNGVVRLFNPDFPTNTWRLNGVNFDFPTNTQIPAQGLILLVKSDPVTFRSRYGVAAEVQIFGPFSGALQDGGETLSLQRPDNPDIDTNGIFIPYIDVDVVRYNNRLPWPTNAAGGGPSLERNDAAAYGNDPVNWRASPGPASPGLENTGNRTPAVNAGPDQQLQASNFPLTILLTALVIDDGLPVPPGTLTLDWTVISGTGATIANPGQTNVSVTFSSSGSYLLRLTANDGQRQASDDVEITVTRLATPIILVTINSVWKYLDTGADLGNTWTPLSFNDSTWLSGAAELGYGDGGEITTNRYGPNINDKYMTTYYRKTFVVTDAASFTELTVKLLRDDGAIVYLNTNEAFRSNMPLGPVNYRTPASNVVGGTDETTYFLYTVPSSFLVEGTNVLAVELHQNVTNSSDISFNLELSGLAYPPNIAPVVNAGTNQSITLPAGATLTGTVIDDGLPVVPGRLTLTWSKAAGPGTVTFSSTNSLSTTAQFSLPGTFTLDLSAFDGALTTVDSLVVTVGQTIETFATWRSNYFSAAELNDPLISGEDADPDGDTHNNLQEFIAGTHPRDPLSHLRFDFLQLIGWETNALGFNAISGRSYTIQFRNSVEASGWLFLTNVPSVNSNRAIRFQDSPRTNRFYRIVTPQQP